MMKIGYESFFILLFATGIVIVSSSPLCRSGPYEKRNRPGVVFWHGDSAQKKVALTFDDGPNEPYTSQILDLLRENKVKATFFLLGKNVETYSDVTRRISKEGHVIGNHSYSHPDMILETNSQVREQILKAEQIIETTTGKKPTIFRPPYGLDDPLTFLETERLGYTVIKWSVSTEDWRKPGWENIVKRAEDRLHNGAILLMHDGDKLHHGSDRSQTVAALRILIRDLKEKGYEFATIPDLLNLKT